LELIFWEGCDPKEIEDGTEGGQRKNVIAWDELSWRSTKIREVRKCNMLIRST
jgi:hypothetical protein